MSIVKDMSLAPSGLMKIQWVRDFMPALSGIEERFRKAISTKTDTIDQIMPN